MKNTNSNKQSRETITPNEPQSKSTQLKMILNLVKNKYLSRQNKLKVLKSMKRNDEADDENIKL